MPTRFYAKIPILTSNSNSNNPQINNLTTVSTTTTLSPYTYPINNNKLNSSPLLLSSVTIADDCLPSPLRLVVAIHPEKTSLSQQIPIFPQLWAQVDYCHRTCQLSRPRRVKRTVASVSRWEHDRWAPLGTVLFKRDSSYARESILCTHLCKNCLSVF